MLAVAQKFSNVQQELLKLYRTDVPDEVLIEIKELLSRFFAERAMDGMDKLWDEQGWNNETMDKWLNSPKEVSHS
jgi:hypothetical protein